MFCWFFGALNHLIASPQHLHSLGVKDGPKAAAKAKSEFAKAAISRIDELGAAHVNCYAIDYLVGSQSDPFLARRF